MAVKVTGIPQDLPKTSIESVFAKYGRITSIKRENDIVIVTYSNSRDAEDSVRFNGHLIAGKSIKVELTGKRISFSSSSGEKDNSPKVRSRRSPSPLRNISPPRRASPMRRSPGGRSPNGYNRSLWRSKSRSRSPIARSGRLSRSPQWQSPSKRSPIRYSRSPRRRVSRSRSPVRDPRVNSPRRYSRSPIYRRFDRSPVRRRFNSPRRYSRSPRRRFSRSRSPVRDPRVNSPRRISRSPKRRPLVGNRDRSVSRSRSRSPPGFLKSKSRSRSKSPDVRKVVLKKNPESVLFNYTGTSSSSSSSRSPKPQIKPDNRRNNKRRLDTSLRTSISPNRSESRSSSPANHNNQDNSICLVELITGITRDQIESLILESITGTTSADISQITINEENHSALVCLSKSELVKSLLDLKIILFFGKAIRIEPGRDWTPTDTGKVFKKKLLFEFSSIEEFLNTLSQNRVLLDEIGQQVTLSTTNVTLQVHSKSEENLNKAYQSISSLLDFHN